MSPWTQQLVLACFALASSSLLIALTATASGIREIESIEVAAKSLMELDVYLTTTDGTRYEFLDLRLARPLLGRMSTTYVADPVTVGAHMTSKWATATLLGNSRVLGLFQTHDGHMFEVDAEYEHSTRRVLLNDKESSHVLATTSNNNDQAKDLNTLGCATHGNELRPPRDPHDKYKKLHVHDTVEHRLLKSDVPNKNQAYDKWFNLGLKQSSCYRNDAVARTFFIGIVADQSLEQRCTTMGKSACPSLAKLVESIVARASAIFMAQMNVRIVARQVLLPDDAGPEDIFLTSAKHAETCQTLTNPVTNEKTEQACCTDGMFISKRLETLRVWAAQLPIQNDGEGGDQTPTRQGHWHLLTDCHPSPGFVGRSFIGTLCHSTHMVGLSSFGPDTDSSTRLWRIFAHELGHSFDATHAFERGMGRTGGLMDYGSGIWQGQVQFDRGRMRDMCAEIDRNVDGCIYFQTQKTKCGDKVLELTNGEECECPGLKGSRTCVGCVNCKLKDGFECVPGSGSCCSEQGLYRSPSTMCLDSISQLMGVCIRGTCQSNVCFGNQDVERLPPSTNSRAGDIAFESKQVCATESCRIKCGGGNCTDATPIIHLPDGVGCELDVESGDPGVCLDGECKPQLQLSALHRASKELQATCTDYPQPWWDADGPQFTCEWYKTTPNACQTYGQRGRNFGYAAVEACCVCGGGKVDEPETTRPTSKPTKKKNEGVRL